LTKPQINTTISYQKKVGEEFNFVLNTIKEEKRGGGNMTPIENKNEIFLEKVIINCRQGTFKLFINEAINILNFFPLSFNAQSIGTLQVDDKSAKIIREEIQQLQFFFQEEKFDPSCEFGEKMTFKRGKILVSLEILEFDRIELQERTVVLKGQKIQVKEEEGG
jgi:hypothetical protein